MNKQNVFLKTFGVSTQQTSTDYIPPAPKRSRHATVSALPLSGRRVVRILLVLMVGALAACSVSVKRTSGDPTALANLDSLTLTVGVSVEKLEFTNTGDSPQAGGCVVQPELPAGLKIELSANMTTCAITGTPTKATAEKMYTVTGSSEGGSSAATITITVIEATPAAL